MAKGFIFLEDPRQTLLDAVNSGKFKEALESVKDTKEAGFLFGMSMAGAELSSVGFDAEVGTVDDILRLKKENETLKKELDAARMAINALKVKMKESGIAV